MMMLLNYNITNQYSTITPNNNQRLMSNLLILRYYRMTNKNNQNHKLKDPTMNKLEQLNLIKLQKIDNPPTNRTLNFQLCLNSVNKQSSNLGESSNRK